MEYKDRIQTIKSMAKYNPSLTDRELSILLDAAFAKNEKEDMEE